MSRNHNASSLSNLMLAGFACCILGTAPARSEQITFRILFDASTKLPKDLALTGHVKMKTMTQSYVRVLSFKLPVPGEQKTEKFKCDAPGTYFSAEITSIVYKIAESTAEQECRAGDIAFIFQESRYADLLREATKENFDWQNFGGGSNSEVVSAHSTLIDALAKNDTGLAMTSSSLMATWLAKNGNLKAAEPFRVLNLDLAKEAMKSNGILTPAAGELFYDPSQAKYVLDNDSVASLKKFQRQNHLVADGKLNWDTMTTLAKPRT